MKHFFPILIAGALSACATTSTLPETEAPQPAEASEEVQPMELLSPERLAGSPSLSGPSPRAVKFSPDGSKLTFLKAREDDRQRLDLWAFDVETGEASMLVDSTLLEPEEVELSEEEKALRERKRIAGTKGVVSYDWDKKGEKILVPIGGDLFLVSLSDNGPEVDQLTDTDAFEYNAEISPSGERVSFIRDGALYAIDIAVGRESRISPEAEPDKAISYGVAEFVAQEEMSRYVGTWWAPQDAFIAFTRVDESTVDIIPRFDIAAEDVTVIEQRYPRAGRPNAIVDLFVRDMTTGREVQVDLDASPDSYLARVNWTSSGDLFVQRVNRDQTRIELLKVDPKTGDAKIAYVEEQPKWVNLSKDFRSLNAGGFLWTTEETGYRHITLHDAEGAKVRNVTGGAWAVKEIVGVNEDKELVFFTGFADTPLEQALYVVSYGTPETEAYESGPQPLPNSNCYDMRPQSALLTRWCPDIMRVTPEGGEWSATLNKTASAYIGTFSSPTQPPQTALYTTEGVRLAWVEENALDDDHPYAEYLDAHVTPEFGVLAADDGQTLHYSILKPHEFDETKTYPVVVQVYGGPHVQRVQRDWRPLSDIMLAQKGYIVFRLDNRGSSNRGKVFEDVIYRQTADKEVADQLLGVDYLKSLPYVDADRIAINGWSYGGYMALMTTLKAPEGTFAASISGAPVTDWTLYDTFYTERYMDTPQDNAEGYELSSAFPHLHKLSSPLLMIHGMADDNVTFDNSTRVYAELQKLKKPFEMMTYPGQRHGVRDKDMSVHLSHTRLAFLERYLKPGE